MRLAREAGRYLRMAHSRSRAPTKLAEKQPFWACDNPT
jgi:hypothetical protein